MEISKNNYGKHWKFHRMIETASHGVIRPFGTPVDPLPEVAPVVPPMTGLTIDTSVAAPPSVSSAGMSATSETAQYTSAARALLKRTERYTEASLMSFLADKYPEIPEELSLIHISEPTRPY